MMNVRRRNNRTSEEDSSRPRMHDPSAITGMERKRTLPQIAVYLCICVALAVSVVFVSTRKSTQDSAPVIQELEKKKESEEGVLKKAEDIVDQTCSFLPDSVKDLAFPLHLESGGNKKPHIWLFDSGVMLKTEYLKDSQMNRFWQRGAKNVWETIDEPLMMKAIGDLYHRCKEEECVFVDGGAAHGYYSQMVRIHFPRVKVLAFNPHPEFVKHMIDNLAVAKVEGICLQQKGLSEIPGIATIRYGTGGGLEGSGTGDPINVTKTSLDDYYDDFGKNKLVVTVKLDIEGHAGKVLKGAPKMIAAAQNIFIGIHNKEEKNECNKLTSAGFSILNETKFPQGFTPNGLCVATRNRSW